MKVQYGLLTPVKYSHSNPKRKSDEFWLFSCECGNNKISKFYDVKNGKIRSCGCIHKKKLTERNIANSKHGYFGTPTYESWANIIERCCNTKSSNYKTYGAKGITICKKWRDSFEEFLKDMGERPEGLSIDRIDVSGNYEPNNCRWADAKTQARNRTNNRKITLGEKTLNLIEWSELSGIKPSTISKRIDKYGWSIEKALTEEPKR